MVKRKKITDYSVRIIKNKKIDETHTELTLKIDTKSLNKLIKKYNEEETNRLLMIVI